MRVLRGNPHAPAFLWGKWGAVVSVGPLVPLAEIDGVLRPEDRQYVVQFDGRERSIAAWESWLEPG